MKDKPLSFQIWLVITIFIIIISVIVSLTTIILINSLTDINIIINSPKFIGTMIKLLLCIIIVNIIVAKIISSRITEPISYLEKKVRLIAVKKWNKSIKMNRKDEIGKLAYSIDKMQENLKKMDKNEEFFLQSISHELKTPIMVIKNYCQALKDGIYIEDSFENNLSVIEEEIELLENKISKLLYLNSLDYILEKDNNFSNVEIISLLKSIMNRMSLAYPNLDIIVTGEHSYIYIIKEKFQVALENIIENSLRYAKSYLHINVKTLPSEDKTVEEYIEISITNDGNTIKEEILNHLFDKFHKGKDGNFGLGLFISKKIIQFHYGEIWAENIKNGVTFHIKIKKSNLL